MGKKKALLALGRKIGKTLFRLLSAARKKKGAARLTGGGKEAESD